MPLLLAVILLAFPIAEIWLLFQLADRYGWWLGLYLLLMVILGWRLIKDEQLLMLGRITQTMMQGSTPVRAILSTVKNMLAGVLLIIPGVMTDVIAVILLLIPSTPVATTRPSGSANDGQYASPQASTEGTHTIEGEFKRED
jgi:UPF0716 protein FxsA